MSNSNILNSNIFDMRKKKYRNYDKENYRCGHRCYVGTNHMYGKYLNNLVKSSNIIEQVCWL